MNDKIKKFQRFNQVKGTRKPGTDWKINYPRVILARKKGNSPKGKNLACHTKETKEYNGNGNRLTTKERRPT